MHTRLPVLAGWLAASLLWTGAASGQSRPDFSGTYDVATITPLQRLPGIDRLVLTEKEAVALEQYERLRYAKHNEPSSPDRAAPPVGGVELKPQSYLEILERIGGGPVGGYNHFWLEPGNQVATVKGERRSSLVVDPPDGRIPAMKPEAQKRNAALRAGSASPDAAEASAGGPPGAFDDPERRPLAERCILGFGSTSGPPTLPNYFYNNLKQIVQTPDSVMILNEMVHDARIIRMNAEHLPPPIRRWMGDSVGRWEGNTLVVDTTNFTDKTQFQGASEQLHVVERFTRLDDAGLLYQFTVEDPQTWDRPWTGEYTWRATAEPIYEYACHEGNYSFQSILRGARLADADAASKKGAQK